MDWYPQNLKYWLPGPFPEKTTDLWYRPQWNCFPYINIILQLQNTDLLEYIHLSFSTLFNLYAKYIMRYTGLEEAQAGIKTAGRNINNLRYADDTTLMAESEEELKSFLMTVKEEREKLA